MEPATIAAQLRELAVYYELDGDRHRAFAYDRAAKSVEAANGLHRLIDEGRLEELPGIGPSIARVVAELARRGTVGVLERLRAAWPAVVIELAQIPRIGVPKARKIFQTFAPTSLDAVAEVCREGKLRELPGFGKTTEEKILRAIEERRQKGAQVLLIDAIDHATSLMHHLRAEPAVEKIEIGGPVRRWCEIVDHLAYAIASEKPEAVIDRLAGYGLVTSVDREANPVIGFMASGLRAELHIVPAAHFGWAHVRATGSKEHVEQLKKRAEDRGMSLDVLEAVDEQHVYQA